MALSQWVQHSYLDELLASGEGRAIGYLLKDRVADVAEFAGTLRRSPPAPRSSTRRSAAG